MCLIIAIVQLRINERYIPWRSLKDTFPRITSRTEIKTGAGKALVPISASWYLVPMCRSSTIPSSQHSLRWHTRIGMLLALTKDRHLSHRDACCIIDVHRGRWQLLSIKILQDSSNINELTAPFARLILFSRSGRKHNRFVRLASVGNATPSKHDYATSVATSCIHASRPIRICKRH